MEILKVVGQVAGLGGIALGVFLIIFREVIRKNIFRTMTKEQSFRIIKLIIILTWLLAFLGIGGWVFIETQEKSSKSSTNTGISNTGEISINGNISIKNTAKE